jgi:sirohydrochlorin ferrochelatase
MEIATPSIPQGLEWLVSQQVDEIICHPYFLSPGRHVTQDIPQIVQQAIQDLQIDPMSIPVRTTEPVGSNTLLMMGAIHALVKEHSQVLRQQPTYNSST